MRIDITPDLKRAEESARATPPPVVKGVRAHAQCPLLGSSDFRELLTNIYDATLITDVSGRICGANERAVGFLEYALHDLCRLSVVDVVSGADPLLLPTICESLQNERFVLIQAYCLRSNGTAFPAEISVNRLHLSGADYLSFFIRDTTLRKEAEDRLRTGSAAIENSGSAIAVADLEGFLQYCNPALRRLLGCRDAEDILETNIWETVTDASMVAGISASIANSAAWAGEMEMRRRDGTTIAVQASAAANVNADGDVTGMVLSFIDTSDQKRVHAELRERNIQMEEDLQLAREFQQAFLRKQYPVFPSSAPTPEQSAIQFASAYRPSGAVGGDFYDVLPISNTRVGIFISDVMGHGVRSALVVATVRGLIEELICLGDDPSGFLTAISRDLHALVTQVGQVAFVTAAYVVVDLATGTARFATAGHPAPYWLRRHAGTIARLEATQAARGPALGIFPDTEYAHQEVQLARGDALLLYTDGLAEAEDTNGVSYETARMRACIEANATCPAKEMVDRLMEDVDAFTGRRRLIDDLCIVCAEITRLLPAETPRTPSSA